MKINEYEEMTCDWCGSDGWFMDDDLVDGKCKICIINDCNHKNIVFEYQGSNHHRIRVMEHCLDCNVFRQCKLYYAERHVGKWDSEDINQGDIEQ
jgi:hypothetical protein